MKIYHKSSLRPYHTFGIEASADELVILETEEEITAFARYGERLWNRSGPTTPEKRFLILGAGSNVLFSGDFHGTVVKIDTKGIGIVRENDSEVLVRAEAGEDWDGVVEYGVNRGWGGLENLSGIPGNAGSSPIQNIGAYGTELSDHLHSLEAIEMGSGTRKTFRQGDCQFGYRDSIFKRELKGSVIITGVVLRFGKKGVPNLSYKALNQFFQGVAKEEITIQKVRQAVLRIRASKLPDPRVAGNAGSFFKNPVISGMELARLKEIYPGIVYYESLQSSLPGPQSYPGLDTMQGKDRETPGSGPPASNRDHQPVGFKLAAGWLIEQCGWKGYREGDAGVHRDQALVLVNYGNASGQDILSLSEKIRKSVSDRFGVRLEPEVNII